MKEKIFNYSIYLAILSPPLYLIRFSIFGLPFNLSEAAIYLALAAWLAFKTKKSLFNNKQFCLPIILLYFGAVISTFFSQDIQASAGILKGWFIAPLILFFLAVDFIRGRKQIRNIIIALFLSGLGVGLISSFYWQSRILTYDGRLRAFYLSPNHLAMCLSPILILSLYLYSSFKKNLPKIILFIVHCLLFIVICLTGSFGAWISVVAGLFLFLFLIRKKISRRFLLAVFLLAAVSIMFLPRQKIQGLLVFFSPSLKSRLVIWRVAGEIIKDHPFVGVGPAMFQKYYLDYQVKFPPYPEWAVPQPHNLLMAFWLQTGLLGLIGFIWLIIVFFLNLKKIRDNFLTSALAATMAYFLLHGLIDTPYWKNDLAIIFWLIIALSYRANCLFYSEKGDNLPED